MRPMLTEVIKLEGTETDFAKVKEAAAMVDAGRLVAFPTETVYGIACRVKGDSLTKLSHVKGRTPDKHYTLHIGQKDDVKKYVPTIGLRAQKLIKNVWPGPVTIVFELDEKDAARQCKSIGMEVFEALYQDNTIGIRCPDNPTATMLLQATTNPVVAPSANITGKPPAINAEQVLAQLSGRIELVLDGGPCKYKKSSTVVKIGKTGWEIVRQGAYSRSEIEAVSQIRFLFVCTGNTCRSPMAEGIFRKYLAEKLQCDVDRLDKIGYTVISAGVMNMSDRPASAEAVTACAAKGIDITAHRSRNLSREIVEESDLIFVMERMHQKSVAALGSEAADKCMLLAENEEIADPIGQPQEFFNRCAELIEKAVRKRIGELVI
jgi:L-threonylcarbamoyladenylate synthase